MDSNKDYYAILGVHPTAEKAVIDAAYKALSKRYHPDMNQDNPDEAKRRMQDINEAYEVLSDTGKKEKYEKVNSGNTYNGDDFFRERSETEPQYDPLEEDWLVAKEYYPDLEKIDNLLKIISWKLAFTFRSYVLDNKKFKNAQQIADEIEIKFLERYFGNNPKIIKLAKLLIHQNKKEVAKELNKTICVIGISKETNEEDLDEFLNKFRDKNNINDFFDIGICKNCGKSTPNKLSVFCDAQCVFEFEQYKKNQQTHKKME